MSTGQSEDESDAQLNSELTPSQNEPKRNKPWHRRPTITPNFGKRQKIGLKSSISQVLLHDNVSQQQLLDAQLNNLKLEKDRTSKLMDLHKKAFLVQQSIKQQHLRATGITHISLLPDKIANALGGSGTASRHQAPISKEVNFVTQDEVDENNNSFEANSRRSSKSLTGSARCPVGNGDDCANPEIAATKVQQHARSHSAAGPIENGDNFMTHDYHLRRERTVLGPVMRTELLQQRKSRTLRALKDPRYISLRKSLVPCAKPVDGYLQLSASGQYVLQRYGTPSVDQEHIQKLIKDLTWIRQSRLGRRDSTLSAISGRNCDPSVSEGKKSTVERLIINHDSNGLTEAYETN